MLTKSNKTSAKKTIVGLFSKKDDIKALTMFNIHHLGKMLLPMTQTKFASGGLRGCVFQVTMADEVAFRKFKPITEDVQGTRTLTNVHGIDPTCDKTCSMVKKWQTMFEEQGHIKTTNQKCCNQIRKTSYAQHQVRQICKRMMEIMVNEVQTSDLKQANRSLFCLYR